MSVLESAGAGLPLAVRGIAAMVSLGTPGAVPGAERLAQRLLSLRDPEQWYAARAASLAFAARHSRESQRTALLQAYAVTAGRRPGGRPAHHEAAV